jgi:hydrogenase maturation protein HypF
MIASLEKFERFGHLAYYSLPGADKASKEAVRPLLSLLTKAFGADFSLQKFSWLLERIEPDVAKLQTICEQLAKGVNCVQTSSLGRVFDAVAALLGLGSYNHFDAQLPMSLEAIAARDVDERYEVEVLSPPDMPCRLSLDTAMLQLVEEVKTGIDPGVISAKFHNTISEGLLALALACRSATNLDTIALSGGVCCNRHLTNRLIKQLKENDFSVLFNRSVPANDGGISLGQAAIATRM